MKLKKKLYKNINKIYTITLNECTLSKCKIQKLIYFWMRKWSFIYLFIVQTVTNLATRHSLVMILMPKFITAQI